MKPNINVIAEKVRGSIVAFDITKKLDGVTSKKVWQ